MRGKFIFNDWGYEIHEIPGEYGFRVDIYKNNIIVNSQGGFGNITGAELYAKDTFLLLEFGIEREYND